MRHSLDHKIVYIWGRIRITNFVRTGNNPGVKFTLPFYYDTAYPIGYRGESAVEQATFSMKNGLLNTTETYSNASNGTLTFMCPVSCFTSPF